MTSKNIKFCMHKQLPKLSDCESLIYIFRRRQQRLYVSFIKKKKTLYFSFIARESMTIMLFHHKRLLIKFIIVRFQSISVFPNLIDEFSLSVLRIEVKKSNLNIVCDRTCQSSNTNYSNMERSIRMQAIVARLRQCNLHAIQYSMVEGRKEC